MQSLHEVCVEGVKLDKEESYQGWSNGVGLNMHKGDNNRGLRGHDQCDARSDRRRLCIRVGASRGRRRSCRDEVWAVWEALSLGGHIGILLSKCLFATRPRHGDAEGERGLSHTCWNHSRFRNHKHGWRWWSVNVCDGLAARCRGRGRGAVCTCLDCLTSSA